MSSGNECKRRLTVKELRIQQALGTLPDKFKVVPLRGAEPRLRREREDKNIRCAFCDKKIDKNEKAIKFVLRTATQGWACLDCQYVSLQVLERDFGIDLSEFVKDGVVFDEMSRRYKNQFGARIYVRTSSKGNLKCKLCGHKIKKGQHCFEVPDTSQFGAQTHFTICIECQWLSFVTLTKELDNEMLQMQLPVGSTRRKRKGRNT